jgi:glycosyltransferase involved in cell wall biosynthesis
MPSSPNERIDLKESSKLKPTLFRRNLANLIPWDGAMRHQGRTALATKIATPSDALKPPSFSVVIPTRNRARLLQRALRSVESQTFTDFEVIIVDDGSTDATQQVLKSIRALPFRLVTHECSKGVAAARNQGIAEATGEFVVFLDDDDELHPNAIEEIHERASASRLDFLWGGRHIRELDSRGRLVATRQDDWSAVPYAVRGPGVLPYVLHTAASAALAVRRAVLGAIGGFDEHLPASEDRDLFIKLARGNFVGAAVPRTIIDVNETYKSLSRNTDVHSRFEPDLKVIDKHREYLERPEHKTFLDSYFTAVYVNFLEAGDRTKAQQMWRVLRQRRALHVGLLRKYVRHAPEFRALKSLIRYQLIRRFLYRRKQEP